MWLSGAAALCSFTSLAEAPCSLSSKLKATRDGERKETGSLWPSSKVSRMLSLFGLLRNPLSVRARVFVCKDGYLIAPVLVVCRVCNVIPQVR